MIVKPENALRFIKKLHNVTLWRPTKRKHHDYLNYVESLINKDEILSPEYGQDEQDYVKCPRCHVVLGEVDTYDDWDKNNFCPNCGQRLSNKEIEVEEHYG